MLLTCKTDEQYSADKFRPMRCHVSFLDAEDEKSSTSCCCLRRYDDPQYITGGRPTFMSQFE